MAFVTLMIDASTVALLTQIVIFENFDGWMLRDRDSGFPWSLIGYAAVIRALIASTTVDTLELPYR